MTNVSPKVRRTAQVYTDALTIEDVVTCQTAAGAPDDANFSTGAGFYDEDTDTNYQHSLIFSWTEDQTPA